MKSVIAKHNESIIVPINKNKHFLQLIEKIPHWETHLTDKQLQVSKEFVTCLDISEVDYRLKLKSGTTSSRIFGNGATNKGAIGRLQDVFDKLTKSGYYEKLNKQKLSQLLFSVKNLEITGEMLNKTNELFRLIVELPEYKEYLSKSHTKYVFEFMRLRNFANTAKYFGIKEITLVNNLLHDKTGVIAKLREVSKNTMINSWDDIR